MRIDRIGSVGDQATAGDKVARGVDRGQFVPSRQRDDQVAMNDRRRARQHDKAAIRLPRECGDGALDLWRITYVDKDQFHPERGRHALDGAQLAERGGYRGVPKHRRPRHTGRDVSDQLQPFHADAELEQYKSGSVAARPRQGRHEAGTDRVSGLREHDWHGAGRLL